MTADQIAQWKRALAELGRNSHGDRGRRYRQRRTGLGAVDGPGLIRVPAPPRQADDGSDRGQPRQWEA